MPQDYYHDVLEKNILLPDNFSTLGDLLITIVEALSQAANVKEIKSRKYIFSNEANIEMLGFKSIDQIIGLTVHDLQSAIPWRCWNSYAEEIEILDTRVKIEKKPVKDSQALIINSGLVRIQDIIKIPVMGALNKPIAILTFTCDTTKKAGLFYLFNAYKKFYSVKKTAINYFLKYLNLDSYFNSQPTEAEILVLLAMCYDPLHKAVAKRLAIEPKTVEIHARNIRKKIQNENLNDLLLDLRIARM